MQHAALPRCVAVHFLSVYNCITEQSSVQILKHIELVLLISFPFYSLRIKYEPSAGAMIIDLPTIRALELIQNLQNAKSRDCLYGLLNQTLTPMGARVLKSHLLQPSTDPRTIETRYEAVAELESKADVFFAVRQGRSIPRLTLLTLTMLYSSERIRGR